MKKYIYKIGLIIFLLFIVSFIIVQGFILKEAKKVVEEEVDYIIVLGARLYGKTPSPSLVERLKSAVSYLEDHEDPKIIVSGGQGPGEDVSEGYAMSQYLLKKEIPKDRIIIEDKSTSTIENLEFSLDKIRENDSRDEIKILIVTNGYHVFRSKIIAKRLGMKAYGLPANTPPTTKVKGYLREYFAVIKLFSIDLFWIN